MAIQINIPDVAQCTPLEIAALMQFWQTMSGSECADTSHEMPVNIKHPLWGDTPIRGVPESHFIIDEPPYQHEQLAKAKVTGVPEHITADPATALPPLSVSAGAIDGALAGFIPAPASGDENPLNLTGHELDLASLFGNQVAGAPPIAPPPPLGGTELDSNNLPWDARIHAATKAKIADGSWRKKRNLDEALEQSVEAELHSIMGAPVPASIALPVPASIALPVPASIALPVPASIALPVPPPAPPAPAAVSRVTEGWDQMRQAGTVTNAQHADKMAEIAAVTRKLDMTFGEFMKFTTPLLTSGQITQQQLATIAVAVGLPHAVALQKREDMIPAVLQRMYAILDGGV